jgi:hypothetical protein
MPEEGGYLLLHVGFSKEEKPTLFLQHHNEILSFQPDDKVITLTFDRSERFCTGWHNLRTGESFVCPDHAILDKKYDQCPACQQRTGFNPAFYHASSVSSQQEERNLEPHILYLAHFGKGIVKVGISHAARNHSRLLEQGARSAMILATFPTAHIARQYEAQIAALPNIAETLQVRKKILALSEPYNVNAAYDELIATKKRIEETLSKTFDQVQLREFDSVYFPKITPPLHNAFDTSDLDILSGHTIGMLGSFLFCIQQETPIFVPLKKYLGHTVRITYTQSDIPLPAQQMTLF